MRYEISFYSADARQHGAVFSDDAGWAFAAAEKLASPTGSAFVYDEQDRTDTAFSIANGEVLQVPGWAHAAMAVTT